MKMDENDCGISFNKSAAVSSNILINLADVNTGINSCRNKAEKECEFYLYNENDETYQENILNHLQLKLQNLSKSITPCVAKNRRLTTYDELDNLKRSFKEEEKKEPKKNFNKQNEYFNTYKKFSRPEKEAILEDIAFNSRERNKQYQNEVDSLRQTMHDLINELRNGDYEGDDVETELKHHHKKIPSNPDAKRQRAITFSPENIHTSSPDTKDPIPLRIKNKSAIFTEKEILKKTNKLNINQSNQRSSKLQNTSVNRSNVSNKSRVVNRAPNVPKNPKDLLNRLKHKPSQQKPSSNKDKLNKIKSNKTLPNKSISSRQEKLDSVKNVSSINVFQDQTNTFSSPSIVDASTVEKSLKVSLVNSQEKNKNPMEIQSEVVSIEYKHETRRNRNILQFDEVKSFSIYTKDLKLEDDDEDDECKECECSVYEDTAVNSCPEFDHKRNILITNSPLKIPLKPFAVKEINVINNNKGLKIESVEILNSNRSDNKNVCSCSNKCVIF